MPKVCLSEMQKRHIFLCSNMKHLKGGRNEDEMAMIMCGKGKNTWRNRFKHPEKLRLEEVYALCDYFKIDVCAFTTRELELN